MRYVRTLRRIMCMISDVIARSDIHPLRMCRMKCRNIADALSRTREERLRWLIEHRSYEFCSFLSCWARQRAKRSMRRQRRTRGNYVPSIRANEFQSRYDRTSSALLLANTRGGQSTVIEGSGRFVGEPPTGAIGRPSEDLTDGGRPRPSSAIF